MKLYACPDCDLLQSLPPLRRRGKVLCFRCGRVLTVHRPEGNQRALPLAVGAAIAFVMANLFPLLGLSAAGQEVDTTIIGSALAMWHEGHELTAALVGLCAVVAPGAYIACTAAVLIAARRDSPAPPWVGELLHWAKLAKEWSMAEVMMLGILVALIKISDLATVVVGIGMFAAGALILLLTALTTQFNPEEIWPRVRWLSGGGGTPTPPVQAAASRGASK